MNFDNYENFHKKTINVSTQIIEVNQVEDTFSENACIDHMTRAVLYLGPSCIVVNDGSVTVYVGLS
jgi:hypothetical protein